VTADAVTDAPAPARATREGLMIAALGVSILGLMLAVLAIGWGVHRMAG
jgi:hypothetical protein